MISLKTKFIYKCTAIVLFIIFILLTILLIYINIVGEIVDEIYEDQLLYVYSILLFFLSLILVLIIIYKSKTFTPSIVLFLFFLAVPLIGSFSYRIFIKYHEWVDLDFAFPTFVWAIGIVSLFAGILISYFVIRINKAKYIIHWNLERSSYLLWFTIGVSFFFSILAIFKIGYIPLFQSDIDRERMAYFELAGEWTIKFSRLWLVVASMSSMFAFLKYRKKFYLFIVLFSGLASFCYGQRLYIFLILCSFLLIHVKFQKLKLFRLFILGTCLISFLAIYKEIRAGRSTERYKLQEVIIKNIFGEWHEYAYVINEIRYSGNFYKETIYLGGLVGLLPKQIWLVFDVDKNDVMHKYGAAWVFGNYLGQEGWGIRIGTIGEAYAGYGVYYGVCLQMFLFGIIFGVLERIYLNLNKKDARLGFVCFLMSLFMYLPLSTLVVTTTNLLFFGFFFILYQIIGTNQVAIWLKK